MLKKLGNDISVYRAVHSDAHVGSEFYLATGMSNCVSPANYNAERGRDYAMNKAQAAACKKLWELEGYRLRCALAAPVKLASPAKLAIIDEMVGRFLYRPFPEDFVPDRGICFERFSGNSRREWSGRCKRA